MKTFDGGDAGSATLKLKVTKGEKDMYVVHRKYVLERRNARAGTASTKTRSEVRGGGRKPFKQKGTGRARQGSIRNLTDGGGHLRRIGQLASAAFVAAMRSVSPHEPEAVFEVLLKRKEFQLTWLPEALRDGLSAAKRSGMELGSVPPPTRSSHSERRGE